MIDVTDQYDVTGDATEAFNRGLSLLKDGQRLHVPDGFVYKISEALVIPKARFWSIGGSQGTYPCIESTCDSPILTIDKRGSSISDLRIIGGEGILIENVSNFSLERLALTKMNTSFTFKNAHDCRSISNIQCYKSNLSLYFTDEHSSSLKFTNFSSRHGEKCLLQDSTHLTDITFLGGGFGAQPIKDMLPVEFNAAIYKMSIRDTRFESVNTGSPLDQISINGNSYKYAACNISLTDNYFTGDTKNAIRLGDKVNGAMLEGNHFMQNPTEADIVSLGKNVDIRSSNRPSAHLERELIVR